MIERPFYQRQIRRLLAWNPVVAILGARQVGKTTLARQLARSWKAPVSGFDLENAQDLNRLSDAMLTLEPLKGLVIIDEIHRRPELFPTLRVLVDRPNLPARFLILGSASPDLLRQTSETLAGRIAFCELPPFSLDEVRVRNADRLWLRGGFPRSFLAGSDDASVSWRKHFVTTFLERYLPQFGIAVPPATMERFWTMLAHYHGQVWNSSEFARSFGVADTTVRRYLDHLSSVFLVRQLSAWHGNIGKRQVKAPKVYIADSGLLHTLLGLESWDELQSDPKLGASWEGFALETTTRVLRAEPRECYFWATHTGAELDLLVVRGGRKWGFEFKRTHAPSVTPSMRHALEDLKLERLEVIYPGHKTFPLGKSIRAVGLSRILKDLKPIRNV